MKRYVFTFFVFSGMFLLGGCSDTVDSLIGTSGGPLSAETIAQGLQEALEVGTRNAVRTTSKNGGYLDSTLLHIPMPDQLKKLTSAMRGVGLGGQVDQFETSMNRAAEQAAAKAAPVFLDAIRKMTFADAKKILSGNKTAATDYFRDKTTVDLTTMYKPIVNQTMEKVGAVGLYNSMMQSYLKIPLVKKPQFNLDEYVTGKALKGLFTVVADEEEKIRNNPAARTSALLRKVFASQ